jgi:two-component system LytT family response regulator
MLIKGIKAIIADDEKLSREYIRRLLADHPTIEIVQECKTGLETLNAILTNKIDLVFLDIQMPELNGFDVIREVKKTNLMPFVIFITAFDQYAVKAFSVSALDYILKPFDKQKFDESVTKAITTVLKHDNSRVSTAIDLLLKMYDEIRKDVTNKPDFTRILVKSNKKMCFVNIEEIYWFEASGDYVRIHLAEKQFLINESIQNLESKLDPNIFIRVHRSYIVNKSFITEFKHHYNGEYTLILQNNDQVKLSRSYKGKLDYLMK